MDDDKNVVAYIYPAVGTLGYNQAVECIDANKDHPGYSHARYLRPQNRAPASRGTSLEAFNRYDREPTAEEEDIRDPLDYEAYIKLTFDHVPKTSKGLRAGRNEQAELYLSHVLGVSSDHFAITFDDNYRLVVRDLGSKLGTTVIYGGTERGRWSQFTWIVGGTDFLKGIKSIVVVVCRSLQFQLVVPQHNIHAKSYRDKVDMFRAGIANADDILDLDRVDLMTPVRTEVPTGVQTPASQPGTEVTIEKKLGQGSFAVVYRVWNVSTGVEYALKKPEGKSFDVAAWRKEALLMTRISHEHVVSLLEFRPAPVPQLHLEFMAEGSIQDHIESHRHFSDRERRQIFAQTSDGLAYLHMLDPQIVHRDIKPANILVKYRRRDAIFVKFADFGLSREGDIFKTICGTCVYLAPEVYEAISLRPEAEEGYTTLVDVWSLGVVLAQLACGLPKSMGMRMAWNTSIGLAWCNKVRERVETMPRLEEDDLLMYVLRSMLCLRPEDRQSATDCRDQSALLLLNSTLENTDRMGGSQCSNNSGIEEPTIRVGNAQKFDSETIDSGNGDRL